MTLTITTLTEEEVKQPHKSINIKILLVEVYDYDDGESWSKKVILKSEDLDLNEALEASINAGYICEEYYRGEGYCFANAPRVSRMNSGNKHYKGHENCIVVRQTGGLDI